MKGMKSVGVLVAVLVLVWMSGCAQYAGWLSEKNLNATEIAQAYYSQDKEYQSLAVTGVGALTLTAAEGQTISVITSSPLQPLSLYPRDPSTLSILMDGLWKVGTVIGSSMVGLEMVEGLSRGPTVVTQPAPIIVGP